MIARKRRPARRPRATFVELPTPSPSPSLPPCTIELENAHQTLQAVSHPLGPTWSIHREESTQALLTAGEGCYSPPLPA